MRGASNGTVSHACRNATRKGRGIDAGSSSRPQCPLHDSCCATTVCEPTGPYGSGLVTGEAAFARSQTVIQIARSSIDEKLVRSNSQGHLLPNTNRDGIGLIAERMRSGVEALQIPHVASDARVVTVGIGTSTVLPHEGDRSTLFDATDAATCEAKRLGRNRVESAVYPRVADVVGSCLI
jgi:hypothetical protein